MTELNFDKDTWIYSYGSSRLQEARTRGYECEQQYHKERIAAEYPGFRITYDLAKRLDFPPERAMKESLKWENAYVAQHFSEGECIAVDNFMGKYQVIKKTQKPWYLAYEYPSEGTLYIAVVVLAQISGFIIGSL